MESEGYFDDMPEPDYEFGDGTDESRSDQGVTKRLIELFKLKSHPSAVGVIKFSQFAKAFPDFPAWVMTGSPAMGSVTFAKLFDKFEKGPIYREFSKLVFPAESSGRIPVMAFTWYHGIGQAVAAYDYFPKVKVPMLVAPSDKHMFCVMTLKSFVESLAWAPK